MKKLILLLFALIIMSCGKADEEALANILMRAQYLTR